MKSTIDIYSITSYRDGGTIEFTTNMGKICQDFRISSTEKGTLWFGYPDGERAVKLTDSEVNEFFEALHRHKNASKHYIDSSLEALRSVYPAPHKKISIMNTVCLCGKSGYWKSDGGITARAVECGHCGRKWPQYITLQEKL